MSETTQTTPNEVPQGLEQETQPAAACGQDGAGEAAAQVPSDQERILLLEADLAAAKKQAAEHYDLYVREVAEMENLRRRCDEEMKKAHKFGIEKFAQNLLPVVDSMEKAIEMTQAHEGPMREGLLATHRQLMHALEVSGMSCIDPQGARFDPNTQQAIAMVPAQADREPGAVAEVFQRGWKIHERVLRPAMVSVVQG